MNETAPITVLLVEDEEDYREVLRTRLTKRGFQVEGVTTAELALDLLQQRDFDVVVLDVRLPRMTGVQALEKIRQLHPEIEVLILTGYADTETAIRVMELGAFDYLMKPVDLEELVARLRDAHQGRIDRQRD